MRFALSDELEFFRATTSRFIGEEMPITVTRALEHDERGFDPDVWRRAAELGWTSLLAPAGLGGGSLSDNPVVDLAIVAEEMGRMVAPGPLLPVNVVIDALTRSGPPALVEAVVPGLMSGATTAAWALAEDSDVWGVEGLADVVLVEDGTDLLLSGRKRFVEAGGRRRRGVGERARAGRTDAGARRRGCAGTHRGTRSECRPGSPIRRSPVRVGARPTELRSSARSVGRRTTSSDSASSRSRCRWPRRSEPSTSMYGETVEYLRDRWSFGRPLASYQALKHRLADMLLMLETAKGCAEAAAVAVGTASPDAARDVSVAKAYVGRVSIEILGECVQLHGGIGMTWEHDLHLYERRAAVNRALYGTPEYHEERLCALVEKGVV